MGEDLRNEVTEIAEKAAESTANSILAKWMRVIVGLFITLIGLFIGHVIIISVKVSQVEISQQYLSKEIQEISKTLSDNNEKNSSVLQKLSNISYDHEIIKHKIKEKHPEVTFPELKNNYGR